MRRLGTTPPTDLRAKVLRRVRQQRDVPRSLQRGRQHPLMAGAGAGLASRLDLRSLAQVAAEPVDFLVVDALGLVDAEVAHLASASIAVEVRRLAAGSGACHAGYRSFRVASRDLEGDVVDVHLVARRRGTRLGAARHDRPAARRCTTPRHCRRSAAVVLAGTPLEVHDAREGELERLSASGRRGPRTRAPEAGPRRRPCCPCGAVRPSARPPAPRR